MRVAALHSHDTPTVRMGLRLGGWTQPVQAELQSDFGPHGCERQIAELRPWGPGGSVTVSCCSIGGHYDAQTLDRDSDPRVPTSEQALQMLTRFFFGPDALSPRIVGPVDWSVASLCLRYRGDDRPAALVRLQIKPLTDVLPRTMASCRLEQDGAQKAFLLYLRPADADPLYTLLRVSLGIDVGRGFTA